MVPSPDGVSSGLHDKVLDVSSPGVVQVRVVPSPDGVSSALHDKVLDVSSPGVGTSKSGTVSRWGFISVT